MLDQVIPDMELGECGSTLSSNMCVPTQTNGRTRNFSWANVARVSSTFFSMPVSLFGTRSAPAMHLPQIEDYPNGYPRFSSLIASHDSFFVARRFLNLRARLLLLKQNRVVGLETKLHKIDRDEDTPLFLGSSQRDQNKEREEVVAEIDEAMRDLDDFLLRSRRISKLEEADPRAVTNLQNWINGTGCIARAESRFLNYPPEELLGISPQDESAMIGLQSKVAENLLRLRDYFFQSYRSNVSRDNTHIYIPTRSSAALVSRALMTPIIVVMLLAPVILCSYLDTTSSRLFAIGGATVVFICNNFKYDKNEESRTNCRRSHICYGSCGFPQRRASLTTVLADVFLLPVAFLSNRIDSGVRRRVQSRLNTGSEKS